jgi:hypothetical protein
MEEGIMSHTEEKILSFGWIPDMPDFRDYTPKTKKIAPMLKKVNLRYI